MKPLVIVAYTDSEYVLDRLFTPAKNRAEVCNQSERRTHKSLRIPDPVTTDTITYHRSWSVTKTTTSECPRSGGLSIVLSKRAATSIFQWLLGRCGIVGNDLANSHRSVHSRRFPQSSDISA